MTKLRAMVMGMVLAGIATGTWAGRYESFIQKMKTSAGPKVATVSATFFGTPSEEAVLDGGFQNDGTVVVVGVAMGPQAPGGPRALVWGTDRPANRAAPQPGRGGRVGFDQLISIRDNSAGFVVRFSPDLQRIVSASRFAFGTASINTCVVADDGRVYVAGRCDGQALRQASGTAPVVVSAGPGGRAGTGYADAYVACVAPAGDRVEWVHSLKDSTGEDGGLWLTARGLYAQMGNLRRFSLDGTTMVDTGISGARGTVGVSVDPKTGRILRGGDRNTSTGREPYRNPFLHIHDETGKRLETLWNWDSKLIGTDKYRLVSDSSARMNTFAPNGDIVVAGWSDGGNTVFGRQPKALDEAHGAFRRGLGIDSAGMGVGSMCSIMQIDPKTYQVKAGTQWISFVPDDKETFGKQAGKPNNAGAKALTFLDDGSLVMIGTAATGLIETPDSWYKYPGKGRYGGWFLTIFTPEYNNLRFSSYLPGVERAKAVAKGQRVLLVSAAKVNDGHTPPSAMPAIGAIQKTHAGGTFDGHIVVMDGR